MNVLRHFLRHRAALAGLERSRPQAPDELVGSILLRIERNIQARRSARRRNALAGALTATLAVALFTVGGVSYAANAANGALKVVQKAVSPSAGKQAIVIGGISAGGDQYRPGYGFGDPNHNHTGPPGLQRQGGDASPPLRGRVAPDRRAALVGTSVTFDEQCSLFISVIDADGVPLLLTQESKRGGSAVGNRVTGPQTKFIRYTLLVPRSVPLQLRIPINLLREGQAYSIRIVAFDVTGNRTELLVPFSL
jgi:hypothetical protein